MTKAVGLSNLILVSPQSVVGYQPQKPDGSTSSSAPPPAFVFDFEGEQSVTLESEITDHYVENNTAIQDQIALRPEMIKTRGFIAELNNVPPFGLAQLKSAADRLTVISDLEPQLSISALNAYNTAFRAYQVAENIAETVVSAWNSIGNLFTGSDGQSVISSGGLAKGTSQNKQQQAFQTFYGYWRERVLFTVQTPWAVFENMAIKNLRAIQDEKTSTITDFEVEFKVIRTAQSLTRFNGEDVSYSGRLNSQASSLTDLGSSKGSSSISVTQGLSNMGVA